MAPVLITSIPDDGWPAEQVDMIARKLLSSTPIPRLPDTSSHVAAARQRRRKQRREQLSGPRQNCPTLVGSRLA